MQKPMLRAFISRNLFKKVKYICNFKGISIAKYLVVLVDRDIFSFELKYGVIDIDEVADE